MTRPELEDGPLEVFCRDCEMLRDPDVVRILRLLRRRAHFVREVAGLICTDLEEAGELLVAMQGAGLVRPWSKDAFELSPRGAEVWTHIAPLVCGE